jgi:hypothetical protein
MRVETHGAHVSVAGEVTHNSEADVRLPSLDQIRLAERFEHAVLKFVLVEAICRLRSDVYGYPAGEVG